jgi:hypothetical protein
MNTHKESRKDKKERWFVSLGYSTFVGRRKIGETIVKRKLSRADFKILDLIRICNL